MKRLSLAVLALASLALATPASAQQQDQVSPTPPQPPPQNTSGTGTPATQETNCTDRRDDDGDGLVDCADADCMHADACESGGSQENSNDRCSDWIDNDGDGMIDCDDEDCQTPGVTRCQGSWSHGGGGSGGSGGSTPPTGSAGLDTPELGPNQSLDDLIGTHGDLDGERTDEVCSDGVDNDGDGKVDCADFGCRFDPSVTVCDSNQGFRLSVIAGVAAEWIRDEVSSDARSMGVANPADSYNVNFSRLVLRALGSIPFIQNSFFLVEARLDAVPRLTFALFQIPLGGGHFFNVNSGSGTESVALIAGTAKQLFLDQPTFAYSPFEQGNGAAAEVSGPITSNGLLMYRLFAAGGSGQFNGNVGGRFFRADNTNFTYTGGGQLQVNVVGRYSRFDTPFLYDEVPLTVALLAGAKWDQRALERYVSWYAFGVLRFGRLLVTGETYGKSEFAYNYNAESFIFQAGFLIWPKHLLIAAELVGAYFGVPQLPAGESFGSATIARPLNQLQWGIILHWFVMGPHVMASVRFLDTYWASNPDSGHLADTVHEDGVHFELQFRF